MYINMLLPKKQISPTSEVSLALDFGTWIKISNLNVNYMSRHPIPAISATK